MQEVGFELYFDVVQPVPWFVVGLLGAGAIALIVLGRAERFKSNPWRYVCYSLATGLVILVIALSDTSPSYCF